MLPRAVCCTALAALLAAAALHAQCPSLPQVRAGSAVAGVADGGYAGGRVNASVLWDPDGPGPAPALLVFGGSFLAAGNVFCENVAAVDLASGVTVALGAGLPGVVHALVVSANGELIAGGQLFTAGGLVDCAMRWNGASWVPMNLGGSWAKDFVALPNGDVVAGGRFAIGTPGSYRFNVARWDGVAWQPMGAGLDGLEVRTLGVMANGDVVAGGYIYSSGSTSVWGLGRWDGTAWNPIPGWAEMINDLVVLGNGDLVAVAAGQLGSNHAIGRWSPITGWSFLGSLPGYSMVGTILVTEMANGDILIGGDTLDYLTGTYTNLARWNGTAWVDAVVDAVRNSGPITHLNTLPNGDTIAGGTFRRIGRVGAAGLARFDGSAWHSCMPGTNDFAGFHVRPHGELIAFGSFEQIDGVMAQHVANFDGTQWQPLGVGTDAGVFTVCEASNGDLIVGGSFTHCGSLTTKGLARWNGVAWSAFAAPLGGSTMVYDLVSLPDGDVLVAGSLWLQNGSTSYSGVLRWNGTSWSGFGTGFSGMVARCLPLPNGGLYVMGSLTVAGVTGLELAYWDGSVWTALPNLSAAVTAIGLTPDNHMVVAVGDNQAPNVVWQWNGSAWTQLGSGLVGFVANMTTLPNGDLAVYGAVQIAGAYVGAARWDGVSWSQLLPAAPGPTLDLTMLPDGHCLLTAPLLANGTAACGYFAWADLGCPANVIHTGNGCAGSNGTVALDAIAQPWAGATFRAVATGIPTNAVVVGVLGLSATSVPLPSLLPIGVAGCTLLVSPDVLSVQLATAGSATLTTDIPHAAVLVGAQLLQQALPIELSATGQLAAATSSNALTLTIGGF